VDSRVLVVNYVMDSQNSLLSHQSEAVASLSEIFKKVTVITGNIGSIQNLSNVEILESRWIPGRPIANFFRLLRVSIPIIVSGGFESVFFHMTDLHCALLSPLIRIRGRRQFLWYAHTKKSRYLRWSALWVNGVVTSTEGSCPLRVNKIIAIGQAIDPDKFREIPFYKLNLNNLVHVGRFDKSKKIDLLIKQARFLRKEFEKLSLTIIGAPANQESKSWSTNLMKDSEADVSDGWLRFSNSISREKIPTLMEAYGCFFHTYLGSLDKTLVEATMLGLPVVSANPEYMSIFGQWSEVRYPSLIDEYKALRNLPSAYITSELSRRRTIAVRDHSLANWIRQLSEILK
jgi:glycosyltransferase involved in cell wall biosynthesis